MSYCVPSIGVDIKDPVMHCVDEDAISWSLHLCRKTRKHIIRTMKKINKLR